MSSLAIIPARGGSKRIPNKNIKDFLGKPIISYSINAAIESGIFEEVMVSTDSRKIAEIAKTFGATIPFLRSDENSNDISTLSDAILEVINEYEDRGKTFDNICCILPTAPFITPNKLTESYKKFNEGNYDSFFPIVSFSYPIQRALKLDNDKVKMVNEEYYKARSQDLESRYHDSGQFYWVKKTSFLKTKKLFMLNSGAIEISELEAQDIDSETDWKLAEMKYRLMKL